MIKSIFGFGIHAWFMQLKLPCFTYIYNVLYRYIAILHMYIVAKICFMKIYTV